MRIEEVTVRRLVMRLKHPFLTSFGTVQDKPFLLLAVKDELGNIGYGESVAFEAPWYTEETVSTTMHMLNDFLLPLVVGEELDHPDDAGKLFSRIRGNRMAKASIEGALWDLYAKRNGISLSEALGGTRQAVEAGISIGIQDNPDALNEAIRRHLKEGYKRIKVKIKPGRDVSVLRDVRAAFPDIALMADANSAYTLEDLELLKRFDEFNLMMIEQPLAHDDIIDHATLQREIETPICLDESIHSLGDVRKAIEIGAARIINIKTGRVGGLSEAKRIHDLCREQGIPVWCGGMLEAGIGRAQNIALASLPGFTLPGDIGGSAHYWHEDIIKPEVIVEEGYIKVPRGPGIGFAPDFSLIDRFTVEQWTVRNK